MTPIEAGSTTLDGEDLARGFEPDSAFYFRNARRVAGKGEIELPGAPPPDLVIEVDITSSSLRKLPLMAAMGIPEVWRFDGGVLTILRLESGCYRDANASIWLPPLTAEDATRLAHLAMSTVRPIEWRRAVADWFERATRPKSL
ncbi:MAG: Uma2 family endonuclease [Acidobacteria bacterium]|nr:Uma2 family endonuclease [Acidobacteriota bacterium]